MSFFDEVLTTVENNRFLRAVQDSKTPVQLDLKSASDSTIQVKVHEYGAHSSYNIRNALNLDLSLSWCFMKYLSSLQLLPTSSTYHPQSPPPKKGKPQRYYYAPQVYIDNNSQLILPYTLPSKLLEKLQIDTTSSSFTSAYQQFVQLKEKHKKIEQEVYQFEAELESDGLEVAQRNELSRTQQPTPSSPSNSNNKGNTSNNNNQNNNSKNTNDSTIARVEEKDDDIMSEESQLRISTATSFGKNASTLSFKKIGRLLLRVLHYTTQPIENRYHTAVNFWNELYTLLYSYQDQIKVIYKRILLFRSEQLKLNTSYSRRLKDRLARVYLNHERYQRSSDQFTSPCMEFARQSTLDGDNQTKDTTKNKKGHDSKHSPSQQTTTLPTTRLSNPPLFESVPATAAGTTVPYESLPKPFTSIPMKEQSNIIAVDPTLLFLAYLLADGVLHYLYKTIMTSVQSYDKADLERLEQLALQQALHPPLQVEQESKSSSRLNALINAVTQGQDVEELKRIQQEQSYLKRKSLIIRLQPFDGYYSQQSQSPHLAMAVQQPLSTLQEDDDNDISNNNIDSQSTTSTTTITKKESPYNIFDGIEYIHARGPPHEACIAKEYNPIHFPSTLFVPLLRCPILYPLLEPLLIASKQSTTTTTTSTTSPEQTTPTEPSDPNIPTTTPLPPTIATASSTPFLDTLYFVLWVKLQEYLESPWSLNNNFNLFRTLGRGAFGTVTGVQHTQLLSVYAVKEISKKMVKSSNKGYTFMVNNERRMLKAVRSPFVLHLHASLHDREKLYLFTDICLGGDLSFHLKNNNDHHRFHYARARFYAAQIILGLEHMHARSIVYRDLKPSNILLDSDGNAKISDLGLSLRLPKNGNVLRHVAGTAGYWAPEIVSKKGTFTTSDYWSLGVMLYEMLCGHRPKLRTDIYAKRGKELIKDRARGRTMQTTNQPNTTTKGQTPNVKNTNNKTNRDDNNNNGRKSFSSHRDHSHLDDNNGDNSHSDLRLSNQNISTLPLGNSPVTKDTQTGTLLLEGVNENALYSKFDHKMSKAFIEYLDAIKSQIQQQYKSTHNNKDTKQTPPIDFNSIPKDKISFKTHAFFTPTGSIINPIEKQTYTPHRFIILPPVLQPRKATQSISIPNSPIDGDNSTPNLSTPSSNGNTYPPDIAQTRRFYAPPGLDDLQPLDMNSTPKQRSLTLKRQNSGHRAPPLPGPRSPQSSTNQTHPASPSRSTHVPTSNDTSETNTDQPHLQPSKSNHDEQQQQIQQQNGGNTVGDQKAEIDDNGNKREEVGSIQSQVLDLLQQEDDGPEDDSNSKKKHTNALEEYDDDELSINGTALQTTSTPVYFFPAPNGVTPPDYDIQTQIQQQANEQQNNNNASASTRHKKENMNFIPPAIMDGVQVKTPLYDKTNKHQLSAPGLHNFQIHQLDKYIIGQTNENVPIRDFRIVATTEDNIIPGSEIERAIELFNNPQRWSPFDQSSKVETNARLDTSILDVDVDYNIDAQYLTIYAVDLFIRLFDPDPCTRLGAKGIHEIKNHPFFTTPIEGFGAIDWDLMSQRLVVPPYKPDPNTVHAKTMDELNNSPIDQKYKNIKLTPEDDSQYAKWYHTDQEHREKELVRILNNNVEIDQYLWGKPQGNNNNRNKGEDNGCCTIQ